MIATVDEERRREIEEEERFRFEIHRTLAAAPTNAPEAAGPRRSRLRLVGGGALAVALAAVSGFGGYELRARTDQPPLRPTWSAEFATKVATFLDVQSATCRDLGNHTFETPDESVLQPVGQPPTMVLVRGAVHDCWISKNDPNAADAMATRHSLHWCIVDWGSTVTDISDQAEVAPLRCH